MKAKEIWVIVPFSRPEWLTNVIDNFKRQTFINKKLVIVENGPAIGVCNKKGFKPDILLTSEPHQADAKNTALEALKEIGAEFWATFDDDDFYGPDYLSELHYNSDKADIIGKSSIFVKTREDKLRLFDGQNLTYTEDLHGPTLSGWLSSTIPFPNTGQWGEDMAQVLLMKAAGASFWATSRFNFIFQRHKVHNHTWHATDHQLAQCWYKFQENKNPMVFEYDVSIEEGRKIACSGSVPDGGVIIDFQEWKSEDSPCYTYAKKNAGSFDDWIEREAKNMGLNIS